MPTCIICQVISSGWVAYAKLYLVTAVEASLLKVTPHTFDPALANLCHSFLTKLFLFDQNLPRLSIMKKKKHLDPSNGNPKYSMKYSIVGGVNKEHICASCMFDAVNWDFVKDKYYGCNSYHVTHTRNHTSCLYLYVLGLKYSKLCIQHINGKL